MWTRGVAEQQVPVEKVEELDWETSQPGVRNVGINFWGVEMVEFNFVFTSLFLKNDYEL
jgi:hypothetical protein